MMSVCRTGPADPTSGVEEADGRAALGNGLDVVLRHRGLHVAAHSPRSELSRRSRRPPPDHARGLDRPRRHGDGHRGRQLLRRVPDRWLGGARRPSRHNAGCASTSGPTGRCSGCASASTPGHLACTRVTTGAWTSTEPLASPAPPTAGRWWSRQSRRTWPARSCPTGWPCATWASTTSRTSLPVSTSTSWPWTACRRTSRRCGRSGPRRAFLTPHRPWWGGRATSRSSPPCSALHEARLVTLTGPGGRGRPGSRSRSPTSWCRGSRTGCTSFPWPRSPPLP